MTENINSNIVDHRDTGILIYAFQRQEQNRSGIVIGLYTNYKNCGRNGLGFFIFFATIDLRAIRMAMLLFLFKCPISKH